MPRRPLHITLICVLALVCLAAFTGCGKSSNKPGETVREGLSTPLDGLRYTVFLTRLLNLKNEEDSGYLPGHKEAPPGKGLYGVFLEACNKGDKNALASSSFYIEDTQGNRFDPEPLPKTNPYAFQGGTVPPENCEPASGSLAQQGPTSGPAGRGCPWPARSSGAQPGRRDRRTGCPEPGPRARTCCPARPR